MKRLLIMLPFLFCIACVEVTNNFPDFQSDEDSESEPSFEGSWDIVSIVDYVSDNCQGSENYDLNASGTWTVTGTSVTEEITNSDSFEDFCSGEGGSMVGDTCSFADSTYFSVDDFSSDCTNNGGQYSESSCLYTDTNSFDYTLGVCAPDGTHEYCETWEEEDSTGTVYETNCGTAIIEDNSATINLLWDEGGCQLIELSR